MVILRCQMFPPSSFRDSAHETSVLMFDSQQNPFNFFILEDKNISKHHFEFCRKTMQFTGHKKGKYVNFSSPHVGSAEKAGKSCGILAQVAIKSTKISLAQSFHGDLPRKVAVV